MNTTPASALPIPPAQLPREALARAAASTGIGLDPATAVEVLGVDPIVRSPLPIGLGASTLQALIGQEIARIWERRGGRPQQLRVDARHAVAALRSYSLLELDGENLNARRPPSPITGLWKCADGRHIFLHESFVDGPAVLRELGLPTDATGADALVRAVARRGAFELEDALAASGLCGALCRTPQEWRAHPHGTMLAGTLPVRITRIGDADPRPFAPGERPLQGLRVLDLTRVLAGPVCGRTLAEHGAEVLHIASPTVPTVDLFEIDTGHGKRQAYLNLNERVDRAILDSLVAQADVFCQSYRPNSFQRRGLGPEDLARARPGLIYVSESAYGSGGSWSGRPGWEQIAQTATGVAHIHGGTEPRLAPVAICDYTTGYFAALGVLAALNRRATEGGSWLVEVSLARSAMWYLELGTSIDPSQRSRESNTAAWMQECRSPYGRVRHVAPCLGMSRTPPRWATPPVPPGSGQAQWMEPRRPQNLFSAYHAHVYFDEHSVEQATQLCQQAGRLFGVAVGRVHQKLVGPHPRWSCQLTFVREQFDQLIPWLEAHRNGLTVLVHGQTGESLKDHTTHASWLGEEIPLNLAMFHVQPGTSAA